MIAVRDALATLPSGERGFALSDLELAKYLRENCNRKQDVDRETRHRLREVLFGDGGVEEMKARIDRWFEHETTKTRIKRMVDDSRFSNITRRIVTEKSTVYAEPATRSVGGPNENQKKYAELIEAMCLDEENEHICQKYNLHRAIIVGPRVRWSQGVPGQGEPEVVLDCHSAATARPVMHPNDNTLVVAWLTRCERRSVRGAFDRPTAWLMTDAVAWEELDEDFTPIPGTHREHGFGFIPWIALTTASKAQPDFWPGEEGEDVTSGHLVGWLFNCLMTKETKAATRQPVISGDTSAMAREQALDSVGVLEAPEGTSITTVEIGTDIESFIKADDHQLERLANNHGMSLEAIKQQGAQSADARELALAPIRERRKKQVKVFRRYERTLAVMVAVVTAKLAPALTYDPVDWQMNFGEPQVVLSKKERLEIFEKERTLGLDNTVDFLRREDPDLTPEMAWKKILRNIDVETERVTAMRDLQAVSGSMGEAMPDPNAPSDNPQSGVPQGPVAERGNEGDAPMREAA